ncbi:MAG: T9SS type A sorting domain-containing protein [Chitinophagales bacterium]
MKKIYKIIPALLLFHQHFTSYSQSPDFMMQGWYWNFPGSVGTNSFMENLGLISGDFADAGFNYVWLPPLAKGTGGSFSVGFDVKDYYDIGEFGSARWGSYLDYILTIEQFNAAGINAVADVIYNHRDGGAWEKNISVEGWLENMNYDKIAAGDQPYPSNRFRCILPLGGTSGNEAGTYYFKFHSASGHSNFFSKPFDIIMYTNKTPADYTTGATDEIEPNGGADCGETNNTYSLGKVKHASIDNSGCGTDEFALTLTSSQYYAEGDTLYIRMYNTGAEGLSDLSDHFIYGLWSGSLATDIQAQLEYQTTTDFSSMPSGKGEMNASNFKPNGNPTQLSGDQDAMFFYYDIDQGVSSSQLVLQDWTKWLWEEKGIRGYRMDAVKHFPGWFMGDMLDFLHNNGINPGMVVGENYDFSPSVLKGWIDDVLYHMNDDTKANMNVRVFDFALRNNLEQACDNESYDVRNLFYSGIVDGAGGSGFNVVTFVNNHDFRDPGQPVDNNTELAYAYILTNNKLGIPCVFYTDYYAPQNLQYKINGLMEAHERYIYGASQVDYLNRFSSPYASTYISGSANRSLIYQLSYTESGKEVIVAINFSNSTLKLDQIINTANIFPGDTLTDIFTVSPYDFITVQSDNEIYLEIPAKNFAVFVEGDIRDEVIDISTPVAIETPAVQGFAVYPNPADNFLYFQLEISMNEGITADIYDLQGKILRHEIVSTSLQKINIENLPVGLYILKMNSSGRTWVTTFIKE